MSPQVVLINSQLELLLFTENLLGNLEELVEISLGFGQPFLDDSLG
jgi:hypothetical protein